MGSAQTILERLPLQSHAQTDCCPPKSSHHTKAVVWHSLPDCVLRLLRLLASALALLLAGSQRA